MTLIHIGGKRLMMVFCARQKMWVHSERNRLIRFVANYCVLTLIRAMRWRVIRITMRQIRVLRSRVCGLWVFGIRIGWPSKRVQVKQILRMATPELLLLAMYKMAHGKNYT